jgi:type IV pilus assembly protein PilQ
MNKVIAIACGLLFWLGCAAVARAQAPANAIEGFEVVQQGGKTIVRITTKEPLRSVPPNFAVANPARIAFDFANTANGLGRSNQDISQGELRSMNVVQGAERTRLVLNLRRPVPHETTLDGRSVVITLSEAPLAQTAPGGQVSRFAEGRADAKHQIRDVDFRRGRGGGPASWWISPTPPPGSTSARRARTSWSTS